MQIVDSLSFVDIRLDFIWEPNLERATNITNSKFLELLQISNNKTQNYWNSNQNGYQMEMPTCACFTQFINGDDRCVCGYAERNNFEIEMCRNIII